MCDTKTRNNVFSKFRLEKFRKLFEKFIKVIMSRDSLPTYLLPYQAEGAEWLLSRSRAVLADEMGLGKTVQAIAALSILNPSSILIVAPAKLKLNWLAELRKFAPELIERTNVVSYDMFSKQPSTAEALIVDEAHYIKNYSSKRTRAVLAAAKHARVAWFLTGTPMPTSTVDMYILANLCAPKGVFPTSFTDFANTYSYPYEATWGISYNRPRNLDRLHMLLDEHVMLRRRKADVLPQLPAKIYTKHHIELTGKEKKEIEALAIGVDTHQLDRTSDVCTTLRRRLATLKAIPAADYVGMLLESKQKVVVFGYFRAALDVFEARIDKYLAEDEYSVTVTGRTVGSDIQAYVEKFQTDDKCRVFIGNIIAAGCGITLTAADTVVFLERDWTPANNIQAEDRIHRIGQASSCVVVDVVVDDSIDEAVLGSLFNKQKNIKRAIDG